MELEEAISEVFNPMLVVPVVALIFLSAQMKILNALYWTTLGVLMSLVPTATMIYFTGEKGLKIQSRNKRPKAYLAGLGSMTGTLAIFHLISAPSVIISGGTGGIVTILTFTAVNYFSKVSIHTGAMAFSTSIMFAVSSPMAILGGLLTVLVGWSRVKLERHTLRQVIYGGLLGLICGLLLAL